MIKHTPGPWKAKGHKIILTVDNQWNGQILAETKGGWFSEGKRLANANLIAAAPEMFDYLQHLYENTLSEIIGEESYEALKLILKKAKGEE